MGYPDSENSSMVSIVAIIVIAAVGVGLFLFFNSHRWSQPRENDVNIDVRGGIGGEPTGESESSK